MKQRTYYSSRKNATCFGSTLKAKRAACTAFGTSKLMSCMHRRRRKRKVGVTLITALKKNKQQSVESCFDEVCTGATPKRKRNSETLMHSENSKPHSRVKGLSEAHRTRDCCTPDLVSCGRNDEADSCVESTMSSCVSPPVIIDDSSDADCSSAADTTIWCNASVSDAHMTEAVDDSIAGDSVGTITHGLG